MGEEVEAEGVLRLRPSSVGQPTAPQVVVEALGTRVHVFSPEFEADSQMLVQTQLRRPEASWCFGNTGVGKVPPIPLAALSMENDPKEVAHIMPRKIVASNMSGRQSGASPGRRR